MNNECESKMFHVKHLVEFFVGEESFIDEGEMFVAERMMSKNHYRYVHVQNQGSSELQISRRYFRK